MQPELIITPFGESADPATVRDIPQSNPSGAPRQNASWEQGFPLITMTPIAAGGIPPEGPDMNGVLRAISRHASFVGGGGQYKWSAEYVAVKGGYPKGAVIQADNGEVSYVSTEDGNSTNFNAYPDSIGKQWVFFGGATSYFELQFEQEQEKRENEFNQFLINTAFEMPPIPFMEGSILEISRPTQLVSHEGQLYSVRMPASFPVILSDIWDVAVASLTPRSDEALRQQLASPSGASMNGYTYGSAHSEPTNLEEKLKREVRSLLDFMPQNRKSDIIAGISTWDSSDRINYAMQECPGFLTVPAGCRFAQAAPIKLLRGSVLDGRSAFDTRPSYGSKFFLLDGSNCEQLITPYAQDGSTQTHFMGVQNILFDGNKAGQTAEVAGGVIKWWGTYVGSWLRNTFFLNQYGTALDFRGGSDVEASHIWIAGCATENGYALDTNAELSGGTLGGLLQFDNLYVENTSINKNFDAKTNEVYRGKNIRFRRLVSLSVTALHTEGAANGVDLDRNREVSINKITSYNIGSTNTDEGALVRHVGEMSQSVNIGPISTSGATNSPYLVRKSAGLLNSNSVPEIKNLSLPFVNRYTSQSDNLYPYAKMSRAAYSNMMAVERIATYSEVGVRLCWGDADDSATATSRFLERGLGPVIGSSINQPGGALKDFVSIRSSGGSGDSITLSDPLKPGSRSTAAAIQAGMIYLGVSLPGLGNGPVLQRTTGLAAAADGIATVVRGNGAPAGGADYVGQFYVDMTTPPPRKVYMGTSFTGAVSDWSPLN